MHLWLSAGIAPHIPEGNTFPRNDPRMNGLAGWVAGAGAMLANGWVQGQGDPSARGFTCNIFPGFSKDIMLNFSLKKFHQLRCCASSQRKRACAMHTNIYRHANTCTHAHAHTMHASSMHSQGWTRIPKTCGLWVVGGGIRPPIPPPVFPGARIFR